MKLLKSKKGFQLDQVPQVAVMLLVVVVVMGIGATILNSYQENQNCASNRYWHAASGTCFINYDGENYTNPVRTMAYNATQEGVLALEDLSDWSTTWAVVIAAAIVIGIISAYLFFRRA